MLSFPNYGEPDKALKHVNLRLLAASAEVHAADLRVVVLLRNSADVLRSTTVCASGACVGRRVCSLWCEQYCVVRE